MIATRVLVVLILSATTVFGETAPHRTPAQLAADYAAARHALDARYADRIQSSRAPGYPPALNRAWKIVGDWTAAYLDSHPEATASTMASAITRIDPLPACPAGGTCEDEYRLSAKAVPLDRGKHAAWAVSVWYPRGGTFFVVARGEAGRFAVRWNVKDLAARHFAARDEIGYWASNAHAWGDGPLIGQVGHLPSSRTGRPRFYVDAHTAVIAGGTYPSQISVWEWDGHHARPLFIRSYLVSLDTPPMNVSSETITIHAKGEYNSFSTCGACVEPEVTWQIDVTPDRVSAGGMAYAVPELNACDELWNAVIRHRSTRALASTQVAGVLRHIVDSLIAEDRDRDRTHLLGMLMESRVTESDGHHVLELSADNLPCGKLRFTIEKRGKAFYFAGVDPHDCH